MQGQMFHMQEETNRINKISKKRLNELRDAVIVIGSNSFSPPELVKRNLVALSRWIEIMEMYKESNVAIVSQADIGLLERYVLTYADYRNLQACKMEIDDLSSSPLMSVMMCNDIKIDIKINKVNSWLLKMEGELFLTPKSKSRAIPRKDPKPKGSDELEDKGFDNL